MFGCYAPSNNHHYPAQSVHSNSPLLNHIAKSTHSTNSLKLCGYKKPGCVLVAANTAAQIITFTVADLGGGGAERPPPPSALEF